MEVLLRNALDTELRKHFEEASRGIPWFLLPLNDNVTTAVEVVRNRLREQDLEYRDQIVAGLSFGFWTGLLGPKYEQLWRDCLRHAFPNSSGRRIQVMVALEVHRYTEMADAIRETALDEKTSRYLLRLVARSFDGDR
ncbi:hypothetical protein [Nocardia sp. NPDC059691]|uniref:hypothetical protein n=1 Tax=Nocardia sp. NPDC059691 TaxID=3346908 RepID=UPI0036CC1AB4